MSRFVFITDIHLNATCGVRNGNPLDDTIAKLDYVVDYANKNKANILIGGDIFDHPTVPDFVKAKAAAVFRKAELPIYTIAGNHDILYNNTEYNYRTSYNLFVEVGLFHDIGDGVDFGDCWLGCTLPLTDKGKDQICVFHGFYNTKDGAFTCMTSDVITTNDTTVVLLGHDHSVYDVEIPRDNVMVVRAGSFFRGIRTDEQRRVPQMVDIEVSDSGFEHVNNVPIKCRDAKEIFTERKVQVEKIDAELLDYDNIITRIRDAKSSEITLADALREVTTEDVVEFVELLAAE